MNAMPNRAAPRAAPFGTTLCEAELCIHTRALQEAIRLTRLGARAVLVTQLTGLEKAVANRLYRQLHGRPSPPGQLPFSDVWYLKQDQRMAQATLVWQLSQRFAKSRSTPARRLIDVYECYLWLATEPLLDIMRVAFVPHLVTVQEWEERTCGQCGLAYVAPRGSVATPVGVADCISATAAGIAARR